MATSSPQKKKMKTTSILKFFGTKQISDSTSNKQVEEPDAKSSTSDGKEVQNKSERKFQNNWLRDYSWLMFDREENYMQCSLCIKHRKNNSLTQKNTNFKTTTLLRHADS